jgi:hypothetical protein
MHVAAFGQLIFWNFDAVEFVKNSCVVVFWLKQGKKKITLFMKINTNFFVHNLYNRADISHQNQSFDFIQTFSLLTM